MNYKNLYPLTIPLIEDHPELMSKIFLAVRPHKEGAFVGAYLLDGSYYVENSKNLFENLVIGERLKIEILNKGKNVYTSPLVVCREDGTELGYIPLTVQTLFNMVMERGIGMFAFCEAKSYESDILKIAVSVYCDKY